jgi:putative endopeptidase
MASGTHTDPSLTAGIDAAELDPAIRPQDDLFRHVNGKWIARTEIPSDKARYGSFYVLAEEAEQAVREIIEEAQGADPGTEEAKIGDLYSSFLDEAAIERRGWSALTEDFDRIAALADVPGFVRELGRLERLGAGGFLQAFVDNDPGDPERYLVFIEQGGLGLPDESYYTEEKFGEIRTAYRAHLERMIEMSGHPDAGAAAQRVFDLETAIAEHHWDNVKTRDSQATYNPMTWAEFEALAGSGSGGLMATWLEALDVPAGSFAEVVVREPSFIGGVAGLLDDARLDAWRDWLRWQVIRSSAPYLHAEVVNANFDFYGKTLTGTPELRARWKRGVSVVEGAMGEAVGRIYVERHFSPSAKVAMDDLVAHLVDAYRESIETLEWMTPATRERALDKLSKFTPKIGYPVKWRDYSSLEIVPDDLLANVRATTEFEFQRELGKIGKPIDRDEWFMTPQTINAYYNPGFNEIVFPASILQYPFFDESRDAAANFGAIGAVIGHEIGHGFDDQGSQFDGDGRLTDWWTAEDKAAFEARTASLISQYDALEPAQLPGHHVKGDLTIGENIGDLGGLGIAWKAYLLSLGVSTGSTTDLPVVEGLSAGERFFLSWAQAWQVKLRDEEALRLLSIDPHSPNEFRCNQIVRNIDVFYSTFEVTPTDALWLDPEDRVTIW